LRLIYRRLEQIFLDLVEGSAVFDKLALYKLHVLQISGDTCVNLDAIDCLDAPDEIHRLGDRFPRGRDRTDWYRGRAGLLR
jgi:hypothetical protein